MHAIRRRRASRALLALVFCLALLGPGAAARAATGVDPSRSLTAGPAMGFEQGLLDDRPGRSLVAPGGKRDDRERPGPALPGVLVAALATASAWAATRRTDRPARRRGAAAAGARAPPLQPALT
jgi:peptidoglycan/LPS O-acetylase OafA/YrhL